MYDICSEPRIYWGQRTFFTDLFYELLTIDCMFFAAISLLLPEGGATPTNSKRHIINHAVPIVGRQHTRAAAAPLIHCSGQQIRAGHEP